MKTWLLTLALQIAALAVLAHRYMQTDTQKNSSCGLISAEEYVITSRNVILPDGRGPAAGDQPFV